VGVAVEVAVANREEALAVSLVNIISNIRQLAIEGATRELRIMVPLKVCLMVPHDVLKRVCEKVPKIE